MSQAAVFSACQMALQVRAGRPACAAGRTLPRNPDCACAAAGSDANRQKQMAATTAGMDRVDTMITLRDVAHA